MASDSKTPVQFRVGAGLLRRIDRLVDSDVNTSRNIWMTAAVERYLQKPVPRRLAVTAEELLGSKRTLMLRLHPFYVECIDEVCLERGCARTLWLLDALMSYLRACEQRSKNGAK